MCDGWIVGSCSTSPLSYYSISVVVQGMLVFSRRLMIFNKLIWYNGTQRVVSSHSKEFALPKLRTLLLNQAQREELLHCRNRHVRPHMREKAAALLKIADGERPADVARRGLLKPHDPDIV